MKTTILILAALLLSGCHFREKTSETRDADDALFATRGANGEIHWVCIRGDEEGHHHQWEPDSQGRCYKEQ
jgi:hypothetical protein